MADLREGDWCHIEIPISDLERAKRFYGEVLGWTFQDIPGMEYSLYRTSENGVGGGLWNPPPGVPRGVLNYALVDEIEPVLERIEKLGGRTLKATQEVPGAGWFAVAADPDGNPLGLWKNPRGA